MSKTLHHGLHPYLFNKMRGISFDDTTAMMLAEDLLNPNKGSLDLALEIAIEEKAWSIVESILNLKEAADLLNEDIISNILTSRPTTFQGKLHLLRRFDCSEVTAIAPRNILCEYVLSFEEDPSEAFPEDTLNAILDSKESIPYRLQFIERISENAQIRNQMQSHFFLEALQYNATLPVKDQVRLDPGLFRNLFLKLEYQLSSNTLPYTAVRDLLAKHDYPVKPLNVWLEETDETDSILDTFMLPSEAFKDLRVTLKILSLLEADPIEGLLKYVSFPMDQDTLCKIVWDCPYKIITAHVLSSIDLTKHGKKLEKFLQKKPIDIATQTLFNLGNSKLIEFCIKHCNSKWHEEIKRVLGIEIACAKDTNIAQLLNYANLLGLYDCAADQFLGENSVLKAQFKSLEWTPTLVNLKHALTMQSKEGTKYLLSVLPLTDTDLLELIDSCVIAGWTEGVGILTNKLSPTTRKQVAHACKELLKT